MSKVLAFVNKPVVSHAIGAALFAAASYFATGHVDWSPVMKLISP